MSVGEFTVSNIAHSEDAREERKSKREVIDITKLRSDIDALKEQAKQGNLDQALEGLLSLEKLSRLAEDITASKASCAAVLEVCYEAGNWKLLEENVALLAKRRSQLKQAVQAAVRQAMSYLGSCVDKETRISLIKTLQAVTEGKIFVEIERARLTRQLAAIREEEGDVAAAAEVLQEVAVETFGAMAKSEKIAFILEQVRLCLARGDFTRAQILSRKVSPRAFVERRGEGSGDIGIEGSAIEPPAEGTLSLDALKLRYYELLVQYFAHEHNYLEIARCHRAMLEVEQVKADPEKSLQILRRLSWFLVLAPPYSTAEGTAADRAALLVATRAEKPLQQGEKLPVAAALLAAFCGGEVIRWTVFEAQFGAEAAAQVDVFDSPRRLEDLRRRVDEHNLLLAARYYQRVRTKRLAEILGASEAQTETGLADLAVKKAIRVKIDRVAGIAVFGEPKTAEQLLDGWSTSTAKLLDLVEKASQQISKELAVHRAAGKAAA